MALAGKVCLVTGATRGLGKGVALQLGEAQATVYITGRTLKSDENSVIGGSLEETAREVEERGGRCIPIVCDHAVDEEVDEVFRRIERENDGQLDILVNNAFPAHSYIAKNRQNKFWEQSIDAWDIINHVGLRDRYRCSVLAAKMMVPRKRGLIVMMSSFGGLRYLFGVAYGSGKAGLDKLAADAAVELREHNVACISLWPILVKTELNMKYTEDLVKQNQFHLNEIYVQGAESTEYSGKCIVHLATDKNVMKKSGKVQLATDLGDEYGFKDIDGKTPWNIRSLWVLLLIFFREPARKFSDRTPAFIKIPKWLMMAIGRRY